MKGLLIAVVLGLAALIFSLIYYLGGFKSVTVGESDAGPFKFVYKPHLGAYYKIVPVIEEVEAWARANGEACERSFGEYLDNPKQVDEDRLRANAGCVVTREWSAGLPEGFQYRDVPARRYVTAEFTGAPSIGPVKVYPKANDYIVDHKLTMDGAVIEIYQITDPKSVKTLYLFPVK